MIHWKCVTDGCPEKGIEKPGWNGPNPPECRCGECWEICETVEVTNANPAN